jgi:DNA-binding response OmpR family regulator
MRKKVLIVDDEPDILDLARIAVEAGGYNVLTATSAEQALPIIAKEKPNLILLDVVLPGTSGLELCRRLKRDPATRATKIIMFTALGTEVDMMLDKKDKADAYTAKPFSNTALLALIKKQLENK